MIKNNKVLIVDLDGSLINTDMLYESFFSGMNHDLKTIFKIIPLLISGRAKLKEYLYNVSDVCIETLPYNNHIIKYINNFRAKGGKC